MRILPQVHFDATGSARVRIVGRRCAAVFHYIPVSMPLISMVCPSSISDKTKCLHCSHAQNNMLKHIAVCWDCKKKRFALLVAQRETMNSIIEQCQKMGVTCSMVESGSGPDILLQRIGRNMEFELLMDTVGFKIPWLKQPDLGEALDKAATESVWARCETESQILEMHSGAKRV